MADRSTTLPDPQSANRGRCGLHLPGVIAAAGFVGRRQHQHRRSAAPVRTDRPAAPSAAVPRNCSHKSAARTSTRCAAGAQPAAVAPADGGDRQGVGPQAAPADPRRGDQRADRRRRGKSLRHPARPARPGPVAALHLAPHARDRGAGRHLQRVPQRPAHRHVRQGRAERRADRPHDDRPRHPHSVYPPKPDPPRPRERAGIAGGARHRLGEPAARHRPRGGRAAKSWGSAAWTARASASCCSPCSGCCAESHGRITIDGKPAPHRQPVARAKSPSGSAWR